MAEISVALGGGGIKGIAHIGVLNRLIREGFSIQAIAGTSAGGIIGSVFASGMPTDEIVKLVTGIEQAKFFTSGFHDGPSLLGLGGLTNILMDSIGHKSFEDLQIPLACTAVDINSAQEVIISKGPVLDAIIATVAIPGIFRLLFSAIGRLWMGAFSTLFLFRRPLACPDIACGGGGFVTHT